MRTSITQYFRSLIFTGLVCFAAALLLSSCSQKTPQEQIVGKWNVQGQSNVMEFRQDGTVMTTENGKEKPSKYKFLNDTNLQIELHVDAGTNQILVQLTFDVAIHKDTADFSLTVPGKGGAPGTTQTMHLSRVK